MRTDEEIKGLIESAFEPLRCVTERSDRGGKLSFRVFVGNKCVLQSAAIPVHQLRNDPTLQLYIRAARDQLQGKGYTLARWQVPE